MRHLRLGTRASELALKQSTLVKSALERSDPALQIEIVPIKTSGDKKQDTPQAAQGDKKDWIYELELALLAGQIDFAVHSAKDVPIDTEAGTSLLPVLERADPFDVFVGKPLAEGGGRLAFNALPPNALVGTASLRRKAQLLRLRPDLQIFELRGNVPTRLRKLDELPELQGIVLARAGLERLGLLPKEFHQFSPDKLMPAVNQGILAVQYKSANSKLYAMFTKLCSEQLLASWNAERACLKVLEADCKSAVSIFAESDISVLKLYARVLLPDGSRCLENSSSGALVEAFDLGSKVGQDLVRQGALQLLAQSRELT